MEIGGCCENTWLTVRLAVSNSLTCYTLPPHVTLGPLAAHSPGTIERLHLAAGTIRVSFGNEIVALESGHRCSCFADVPHQFDNCDGTVEALIYLIVETA